MDVYSEIQNMMRLNTRVLIRLRVTVKIRCFVEVIILLLLLLLLVGVCSSNLSTHLTVIAS